MFAASTTPEDEVDAEMVVERLAGKVAEESREPLAQDFRVNCRGGCAIDACTRDGALEPNMVGTASVAFASQSQGCQVELADGRGKRWPS